MAFLARFGGRSLRVEAAREPDSRLVVRVEDGDACRTRRLALERVGHCLLAGLEDGRTVEAFVERRAGRARVWLDGTLYELDLEDERARRSGRMRAQGSAGSQEVTAPMPGKVVRHLVAVGDRVEVGQGVIVVEAMKMENELRAATAGVVRALPAAPGSAVEMGAVLAVLE